MQAQLKELLLDIRGDDPATGFISYDRFERSLARMLEAQKREMSRDGEDRIIAAFRALDVEVRRRRWSPLAWAVRRRTIMRSRAVWET